MISYLNYGVNYLMNHFLTISCEKLKKSTINIGVSFR